MSTLPPPMPIPDILPQYAQALAQDLFDALWLEQLYNFRAHCIFNNEPNNQCGLCITLDPTRACTLHFQGRHADGLRPFRMMQTAPQLQVCGTTRTVSLVEAVAQLQSAVWWDDKTGRFLHFFSLAQRQAEATAMREPAILAALQRTPTDLLCWEVLSCLKDRPFHPLARAKDWGADTVAGVATYLPASMTPFALRWIAVPRAQLLRTSDSGQPIAARLLDPAQLEALRKTARQKQVDSEDWIWMPVHPWQWQWLQHARAQTISDCMDLGDGPVVAAATASLRSLVLPGLDPIHLKLALSVNTLGAIRTLPPRYLHNAVLAATCLQSLRERDPWLATHLFLCDETQWWAHAATESGDAALTLISNPGELACLIRRYPALPDRTFIPMAALPVRAANGALPAFDYLLGANADQAKAWQLFGVIARLLTELGIRCLINGVMPELHGQNLLLICREAHIEALLLRDHDTLRICPAAMQLQDLAVPAYRIDRSTANTLELDTLPELLAYFQTLAIEVNLYAILAAIAQRYGQQEARGWEIVRQAVSSVLSEALLPPASNALVRELLLEASDWPFKQVLAPLLARASFSTGMPSNMGRIVNPLSAGAH